MTAGRHRGYTPHVDCDAKHVETHYPSMHAFLENPSGGAVCRFISKSEFLSSCEKRSLYADRREKRILWFVAAYAVPLVLWLAVLVHMLTGW